MEESTSAPPSSEQEQPGVNSQPPPSTALASISAVQSTNPQSEPQFESSNTYQSSAPETRPAFNTRPWQQPPYSHFSLPSPPLPSSAASSSSSITAPRGAVAIGVLAHSPSITSPSSSQQSQVKQPLQGVGTAPTSAIWPTGIPSHLPRPSQPSPRPLASSSSQSQALQPQSQPWQSSGTPGKPPLPTTSLRPIQQRSYIPQQQHHKMPAQQQPASSSQQSAQSLSAGQHQSSQSLAPQRVIRGAGLGTQRPTPGVAHAGASGKVHSADVEEFPNRIINKRSIKDISHQIDPSETLDPAVESILMEIGEEYLESIVTFGCSLAKHRKSSSLEAKDILLHVEKHWNMSFPGFGVDEIKTFKKPVVADIHKERLAAVKKSIMVGDKNAGGTATGSAKSHFGKGLPSSSTHP